MQFVIVLLSDHTHLLFPGHTHLLFSYHYNKIVQQTLTFLDVIKHRKLLNCGFII